MRRDYQIAIVCSIASIPAGLATSTAIEYFPTFKQYPGAAFWTSGCVTMLLLASAAFLAIHGESTAAREGAKGRMIPSVGVIVSSLAFFLFFVWHYWPSVAHEKGLLPQSPTASGGAPVLKRKYAHSEAEGMIIALGEITDVVHKQGIPAVDMANKYGAANWYANVAREGKVQTIQHLMEIKARARGAIASIFSTIDNYPRFRVDLIDFINANGIPDPTDSIDQYIRAIEALPDIGDPDYIKFRLGESQERFRLMMDRFVNWIADFDNIHLLRAKAELSAFL
jgi:hypothetical protein